MLVLKAKLRGKTEKYNLIDESIRTALFMRNKLQNWLARNIENQGYFMLNLDISCIYERHFQTHKGHTQIHFCDEFDLGQVDANLLGKLSSWIRNLLRFSAENVNIHFPQKLNIVAVVQIKKSWANHP